MSPVALRRSNTVARRQSGLLRQRRRRPVSSSIDLNQLNQVVMSCCQHWRTVQWHTTSWRRKPPLVCHLYQLTYSKNLLRNLMLKTRSMLPKPHGPIGVALLSISIALNQTPVYAVRPQIWGYCIAWCWFTPHLLLVPSYTAWWQGTWVWTTCPRLLLNGVVAGVWTRKFRPWSH